MKIAQLAQSSAKAKDQSLKESVLAYLEGHPDEVFRYRDEELARELKAKPSALGFTLWWLESKGLIEKHTVEGHVYFGSHRAIEHLRETIGQKLDPFERARRNREKIFKRTGNIDTAALLEDVREGRGD